MRLCHICLEYNNSAANLKTASSTPFWQLIKWCFLATFCRFHKRGVAMTNTNQLRTWIALTVLLLGGMTSFGAGQKRLTKEPRPAWIDNPQPGYYIGISHKFPEEADARTDALNNAKRQIIESLGGIVESELIDSIIESGATVKTQDAFTNSRVKVVAKNIVAVKPERTFVEEYQENSGRRAQKSYLAFVMVYFDEAAHREFLQQLVAETVMLGNQQFLAAQTQANAGQIFLAIDQLRQVAKNIQPLTEITGLPAPEMRDIQAFQEQVRAGIETIRTGLRIEIRGERQVTKWGEGLPEPLVVMVSCQIGEKRVELPGLAVDFNVTTGQAILTPQVSTNAQGEAVCQVTEVRTSQPLKIAARVHFPEGYDVSSNSAIFNLLPDNRVVVKVTELNLGKVVALSNLENALSQALTAAGFTILENNPFAQFDRQRLENLSPAEIGQLAKNSGADLILLGSIVADQPSKIQEDFYFMRAKGTLKIFNARRQTVIDNFLIEDKSAGNSPENAGAKAIAKVSDLLVKKMRDSLLGGSEP